MKTILSACLALVAVSTADAQIFRSHAVTRAVAGHPERAHGHGRERSYHDFHGGHRHGGHFDRHRHVHVSLGYYGGLYRPHYFPRYSHVPSYAYYDGYGYGYPYYDGFGDGYYAPRSAAASGLVLGALAGGIIGHNSGELHHSAWRGSAWGAGLGWLLGSVVDANRRVVAQQPAPIVVQPAPQVQSAPATPTQPQQVTIINNYYHSASPMSGVNGMFGR